MDSGNIFPFESGGSVSFIRNVRGARLVGRPLPYSNGRCLTYSRGRSPLSRLTRGFLCMFLFNRKALAGIGITATAVASTALFAIPAQAASAGIAKVVGSSTVQFNALLGKANS